RDALALPGELALGARDRVLPEGRAEHPAALQILPQVPHRRAARVVNLGEARCTQFADAGRHLGAQAREFARQSAEAIRDAADEPRPLGRHINVDAVPAARRAQAAGVDLDGLEVLQRRARVLLPAAEQL